FLNMGLVFTVYFGRSHSFGPNCQPIIAWGTIQSVVGLQTAGKLAALPLTGESHFDYTESTVLRVLPRSLTDHFAHCKVKLRENEILPDFIVILRLINRSLR